MGNKSKWVPNTSRGKYARRSIKPKVPDNDQSTSYSTIPPTLDGCRIINLDSLQIFIGRISSHSSSCGDEISLSGESRDGLASILTAQCKSCQLTIDFPTSSKVRGPTGNSRWECNLSSVWGQMAIGGGHHHLQESLGALGIPTMTKKSFKATEKIIGKWWWDLAKKSCSEAAAEEKKLAIERGSFHEGVPAITVIVDGGWSKRSHKHSYNAKSGVAIIIGKETGKLLHIGVHNKYCTTCTQYEHSGKEPPNHDCQKDWDGPSSSMERDLILQGFKQADEYGLRYMKFIGDGDSSVFSTLVKQVPVWGHAIEKTECTNHAVKCYRTALENLVKNKPQYKGKGKLTDNA